MGVQHYKRFIAFNNSYGWFQLSTSFIIIILNKLLLQSILIIIGYDYDNNESSRLENYPAKFGIDMGKFPLNRQNFSDNENKSAKCKKRCLDFKFFYFQESYDDLWA